MTVFIVDTIGLLAYFLSGTGTAGVLLSFTKRGCFLREALPNKPIMDGRSKEEKKKRENNEGRKNGTNERTNERMHESLNKYRTLKNIKVIKIYRWR